MYGAVDPGLLVTAGLKNDLWVLLDTVKSSGPAVYLEFDVNNGGLVKGLDGEVRSLSVVNE